MHDTAPPSARPGSSKIFYVFLLGGAFFLAASGVIIFHRAADEPPKPQPQKEKPAEQRFVSAPLSIAEPTRPIVVRDTDSGQTGQDSENALPALKGSRGGKSDRTGTIDAGEVNGFINARFAQVKACYERRLKHDPMLEGKLDLNIAISVHGEVKSVGVNRDTLRDSQMLECVVQTIKKWSFPKPVGGGVTIGKTFNFKKTS